MKCAYDAFSFVFADNNFRSETSGCWGNSNRFNADRRDLPECKNAPRKISYFWLTNELRGANPLKLHDGSFRSAEIPPGRKMSDFNTGVGEGK